MRESVVKFSNFHVSLQNYICIPIFSGGPAWWFSDHTFDLEVGAYPESSATP